MFGLKNESKQSVPQKEQTVADEIAIHTMQDELDVLEGKKITQKEESKSFQSSQDKTSKINNKIYPVGNIESDQINFVEKSKLSSPFLSTNIPKDVAKQPVIIRRTEPILKKNANSRGILVFLGVISAVIIFAAGLYYFWLTRNDKEPEVSTNVPPIEVPKQPAVKIEPEMEKFSLDKPNYLRFNLMEAGTKSTLDLFSATAKDILAEGIGVPVEFVAVDENNNPISFQIFANIAGINLPKNIIANLGDFLMYFYSDAGNVRMGMNIKMKENSGLVNLITKEEKNLPSDLASILLEPVIPEKGKIFKNGVYKNFAIRYMNLDAQETISVDYAITNNLWVIGTSKNTIRAILDK